MKKYLISYDLYNATSQRYSHIDSYFISQEAVRISTTTWIIDSDINYANQVVQRIVNTGYFNAVNDRLHVLEINTSNVSSIANKPKAPLKRLRRLNDSIYYN